jgi:hypothetical protein
MPEGDDFSQPTKEMPARRVGYRCSNPHCRKPTSGPHTDRIKAVNIGVAAAIPAGKTLYQRQIETTET